MTGATGSDTARVLVVLATRAAAGSLHHHHALAAGATDGPSLCGLPRPSGGWVCAGFTARPVRISCPVCREAAAR